MQTNPSSLKRVRSWPLAASALALSILAACGGGGSADGGVAGGGSGSTASVPVEETSGWWATASKASNLQGAVYTSTLEQCDTVNRNLYALKSQVTVQGGPQNEKSAGLVPEAKFYVRVTSPSGNVVLGTSVGSPNERPIETDATGKFTTCYVLVDILRRGSDSSRAGYDDTPNNGNEYKLWVSLSRDFDPNLTKTDTFKVAERDTPLPPQPTTGSIIVRKFYDKNVDGQRNADEVYLTGAEGGWLVGVSRGTMEATARTEAVFNGLALQEHSVWELMPDQPQWYATNVYAGPFSTSTPIVVTAVSGTYKMNTLGVTPTVAGTAVTFGNVCTGDGGQLARTIGYWMNKGQSEIGDSELAALHALNLRNEDASKFDPTTAAQLSTWIQGARAKNMAYMLSAQLAAMKLNVITNKVSASAILYAPAAQSTTHVSGFATVAELMDAADTMLGRTGSAFATAAERQRMGLLKDALDLGNNRQNFVMAEPCPLSFATATAP
ncbi:hypothetical protein [Ramlibacter rhizophilus]|uniref:Lipoprotein n=1 Tax=Ramlibacter rhizophilus TaxID=1781167 RepID=A0A4Z0BJ53_9BURK|nr:hypothetical protein [Ramlibacter rhizophilus]TFY98449.1 hypothetical protein EZ242_12950 [Ramlibacter rhizophilus]